MILKTKFILLFLMTIFTNLMFCQNVTLSGKTIDKDNGESLLGCNISLQSNLKNYSTTSNEYGFYSITFPKGNYTIKIAYVGYTSQAMDLVMEKNVKLNIELSNDNQLEEVVVTSKKNDKTKNTAIGVDKLNIKDIEKLPVLFGEKDVLKTIQLLPGVKSNGEGGTGFSVRGGGFDQNLILLDEAPIYNSSHLLGFFSTFNSDALKSTTLIKGNPPAQYGGRLSSVLDVVMKDGNNQEFGVSGGIGLISSRINVEGPIQKGKSSFLISARRTYADLFLKLKKDFQDNTVYFYDLNMKANYEINDKNKIFVSGYFGRDELAIGNAFGVDWGNATGTLRWNSVISPKIFVNTSLIYSKYSYNVNIDKGSDINLSSEIEDYNLKQDYQWFHNSNNKFKFGFNSILHNIDPSKASGDNINQDASTRSLRKSWENALYFSHENRLLPWMTIEYGLRFSSFSIMGAGKYNIYDGDIVQSSVILEKREIGKTYNNFEPRFSSNFNLNDNSSIKAAYARNTQNLHLLTNSTSGRPSDQWIGSSYNIKPEISDQISMGYFKNFQDGLFELSIETYYKWMQNQVDYKNGANINTSPDLESELLYGQGRAYGLEMQLKKTSGKFTGWVSYTLSKTQKQIDGINDDLWYNATQDKTNDISVVASFERSKKWTFSALFVYSTGNAVTFPSGKYNVNETNVYYYNGRNRDRMPDYHRLDLSATMNLTPIGKYKSSLNFSIYNAYGRENAYSIDFEDDPNDATKTRAVQTALFKFVPSITYNFNF
jgi:hypothetical protein